MRVVTGIRVGLALCGWGLVFGVVAALLVFGLPVTLAGDGSNTLWGVVVLGVAGAVLGAVLGSPAAVVSAAKTPRDPRTVARAAMVVYVVTAAVVAAAALLLDLPDSWGWAKLAMVPVLVTLPFAAMRVHRTVRLSVAREVSVP